MRKRVLFVFLAAALLFAAPASAQFTTVPSGSFLVTAATATQQWIVNPPAYAKGLYFEVYVTSGVTLLLTPRLEVFSSLLTTALALELWESGTVLNSLLERHSVVIYPGIDTTNVAAVTAFDEALDTPLPTSLVVEVVHGNANAATYRVVWHWLR